MECACQCHGGGPYAECDDDGGCGHLHPDHRCANGDRCRSRAPIRDDAGTVTGGWWAAPIEVSRGLCERCTAAVSHALIHLVGDVVELSMMLGRVGTSGDVVVTGSRELKIPILVNLEALRALIDSELQAWAEPVAEVLGIEWDSGLMHRSRLAPRVQRAARLLTASVGTLLALPTTEHPAWRDGEPLWDADLNCQDVTSRDGIDAGLSFTELHRLSYLVLGRAELVHRLPHPCPWCSRLALVRRNGEDNVECEHCRKIVRRELLDWLAIELIKADVLQREQAAIEAAA